MRHTVIEAVLNEILGLHNKSKAVVHKLTGPKNMNTMVSIIIYYNTVILKSYGTTVIYVTVVD